MGFRCYDLTSPLHLLTLYRALLVAHAAYSLNLCYLHFITLQCQQPSLEAYFAVTSSLKWPVMCRVGCQSLLTRSSRSDLDCVWNWFSGDHCRQGRSNPGYSDIQKWIGRWQMQSFCHWCFTSRGLVLLHSSHCDDNQKVLKYDESCGFEGDLVMYEIMQIFWGIW